MANRRGKVAAVTDFIFLGSKINSMDMNLSKLQEIVKDRGAWGPTVHGDMKEFDMT